MGVNSIRSNLDASSMVGTLRLALGADIEKKKTYLIVEGEDDRKLLKKFCHTGVTVYESYSGKHGVLEIIENSYIDDKRVVGIRDRDYCIDDLHERMFFYDKSCNEMMILSSESSFHALFSEFYLGDISISDLKKHIFKNLHYLSLFRKHNELNDLRINFKGLSLKNVLGDDLVENPVKLVKELSERSPKCLACLEELYNTFSQYKKVLQINEYFNLVNGHDFIQLFREHCNSICDKKAINDKQISSSLRTSFNFSSFKLTNLYIKTQEYCKHSDVTIWME